MTEDVKDTPEAVKDVPEGEAPKITTVVKTKNPKHVAAGKRLAEISKAAKERKMRERIKEETEEEDSMFTYSNILGALGVCIGAAALIYEMSKKGSNQGQPEIDLEPLQHVVITKTPPPQAASSLESFD